MKHVYLVCGALLAAFGVAACDRHETTTAVSPHTAPVTPTLNPIGSPVPSAASTVDDGGVAETMQPPIPDSPAPGSSVEPLNGPLGDVTVSVLQDGAIADAQRALSALGPRLRVCYNRGLRVNPNIAGVLVLQVTRDDTGAAHAVTVLANKGVTDGVAECAVGVVQRVTRLPRAPTSFQCRLEFNLQ